MKKVNERISLDMRFPMYLNVVSQSFAINKVSLDDNNDMKAINIEIRISNLIFRIMKSIDNNVVIAIIVL